MLILSKLPIQIKNPPIFPVFTQVPQHWPIYTDSETKIQI